MDTTKPAWIVLWAFCVLTFGITLLPSYGFSRAIVIFGYNFSSLTDVQSKFAITINPANWTFFIFNIVNIWQVVWMVYTGTLIARISGYDQTTGDIDGHLYYNPPFIDARMFIGHMVSSFFNFIWNVFWCLKLLQWSFVAILLMGMSLLITFIISIKSVSKHGQELINRGKKKDVIAAIGIVQWGVGIYLCYFFIAVLINLTVVFQHYMHILDVVSSASSLAILLVLSTIYFAAENFYLVEKQLRYFFFPYLMNILFLLGVLTNNWSRDLNTWFMVALLVIQCIFILVKTILVYFRSRKDPLFDWNGTHLDVDNVRYTEISSLLQ